MENKASMQGKYFGKCKIQKEISAINANVA